MPKDERQKHKIIVHKTLHRTLKIEQHEPQTMYGKNNDKFSEYYALCGTSQMVEIFNIFEWYYHRDNFTWNKPGLAVSESWFLNPYVESNSSPLLIFLK